MSCPPPPAIPANIYAYVAINIQAILYGGFGHTTRVFIVSPGGLGVQLVLYFNTMHTLLVRRPHRTSDVFYVIFSTGMLTMVTFAVTTTAYFIQTVWLVNGPRYPAGPDAYALAHVREWYHLLGFVAIVVLQQMTDGLMMYRARLVWDSYRVIIIPFVLWLTTLAMGIVFCWATYLPGHTVTNKPTVHYTLAYFSISVFLNFTLTALICVRVLVHARRVRKHIGVEYTSPYLNIVIIIVESALPYTLSGIMYVISLAVRSPIGFVFFRLYILMMAISPQMLILRVARGIAWGGDSVKQPPGSTIKFSSSTQYTTAGGGEVDASDVEKSVSA